MKSWARWLKRRLTGPLLPRPPQVRHTEQSMLFSAEGRHDDRLCTADLTFLDGPEDGVFERRFLDHMAARPSATQPVLVFDDTQVWNMLQTWRGVHHPKLDLTSFGHWSGTGLVHWVGQ